MLIGSNLYLRPTTGEDAELLAEWYNDPAFLGEFFNHWPRAVGAIRDRIEQNQGADRAQYLIVRTSDNTPVGLAGFLNPLAPEHAGMFHETEIWYMVHPDFRRQRIASETACLLVNHLFSARPIERIVGFVLEGNEGSVKALQNAGMQHEGLHRHLTFLHGKWHNVHELAIIRDDWISEPNYRRDRSF